MLLLSHSSSMLPAMLLKSKLSVGEGAGWYIGPGIRSCSLLLVVVSVMVVEELDALVEAASASNSC